MDTKMKIDDAQNIAHLESRPAQLMTSLELDAFLSQLYSANLLYKSLIAHNLLVQYTYITNYIHIYYHNKI